MSEAAGPGSTASEVRLGSYRLIEPLGSGGMSSVFRAVHEGSGAVVALKVLPRYLAKNPVLLQRFLREAKSAESLDHPNIVSIYDHGTEDGRYYLVLEYVDGADLHDRVRREGPVGLGTAVRVASAVAEALAYATSKHLIHRDIKPANILLDSRGRVKLIDLGLALQSEGEDERVTRDGTTVGTVDYMPPEQARDSRAATTLSDQYSLGCTLYYLLTGLPPFPGGDIADKLRRHAIAPVPDLVARRPDAPIELASILRRMMAKSPAERYPDYDALLADLAALPESVKVDAEPGIEFALVDDEESESAADFTLGPGTSRGPAGPTLIATPSARGFGEDTGDGLIGLFPVEGVERGALDRDPPSLGDLVALDEEASTGRSRPTRIARPTLDTEPESAGADLGPPIEAPAPSRPTTSGTPAPAWAAAGGAAGLVVALAGVALLASLRGDRVEPAPAAATDLEIRPRDRVVKKVERPAPPIPPPEPDREEPPGTPPADPPVVALEPEPTFSPEVERRFGPLVEPSPPAEPAGTIVRADRLDDPALTRALESTDGTIELDDLGPFFVHDLPVRGRVRRWRAPDGRRAILAVRPPDDPEQASAVVLEAGTHLILERLDLVVPVARFSHAFLSLFECRDGARIEFHDCTVTVVGNGAARVPLAVLRVVAAGAEERPALLIRGTMLRSSTGPIVAAPSGGFAIDVEYSALIATGGPILEAGGPADVRFRRSLLVTSGRVVESAQGTPVDAKALACQFVRAGQGTTGDLVADPDGWVGLGNRFLGFDGVPATDEGTDSAPSPFGGSEADLLLATPTDLADLWPKFATTLHHVSTPASYLFRRTLDPFRRTAITDEPTAIAGAAGPVSRSDGYQAAGGPIGSPGLRSEAEAGGGQRATQDRAVPPAEGTVYLDLDDRRTAGDLAALVEALVTQTADPVIRVEVIGNAGPRQPVALRPIRVAGRSLELRVSPTLRGDLVWRVDGTSDPAFEVRGGDLRLSGFHVQCEGRGVLVEGGRLELDSCWLLGGAGQGALVEHRSESPGSAEAVVSLLDVLLISGGDGLRVSEVGGVVRCRNAAIAARGPAIRLACDPAAAGDAFRAELWLDRSTITSESALVDLEAWAGPESARPHRPWVVFSRGSHLLDDYAGRTRSSWVLHADADAFRTGGIVWQGEGDLYDVGRFIGLTDDRGEDRARSDFRRDWVRVWGEAQVRDSIGPQLAGPARRKLGRLEPGSVTPRSMAQAGLAAGRDYGALPERLGLPDP